MQSLQLKQVPVAQTGMLIRRPVSRRSAALPLWIGTDQFHSFALKTGQMEDPFGRFGELLNFHVLVNEFPWNLHVAVLII
jgi:hypothetical protein